MTRRAALWGLGGGALGAASGQVALFRVPGSGLQPQAAADGEGRIHAVYLQGDPAAADVWYAALEPGRGEWSALRRVNTQARSAVALGTVRGARLAVGKGRVHVVWNGSRAAQPAAPDGTAPLLYTHGDAGGFAPERNLARVATGLDGGGAVSADEQGAVSVLWHAAARGRDGVALQGEEHRQVWVARSTDGGGQFEPEIAVSAERLGACGCCGMASLARRDGTVYALYRTATGGVHRDSRLLTLQPDSAPRSALAQGWDLSACPMSTYALAMGPHEPWLAWETEQRVSCAPVTPIGEIGPRLTPSGGGTNRKHPTLAVNRSSDVLLAWTEGTGWKKGGALAWQVFDAAGRETAERGRVDGVPAWSLGAAFLLPDGRFGLVY